MNGMKFSLDDIEMAYMYGADAMLGSCAVINKATGKILYLSDDDGVDAPPEDIDDDSKYLEIPNKHDFDLGNQLAFEFAELHEELDYDRIRSIFRKRAAYSAFKDLLESKELLDQWYAHEDSMTKTALKEWCSENEIELGS